LQIQAGARTDIGRVRKNNEDCFAIDPSLQLYVLSDGMGGQAHGEVASNLAVQTILTHCRQAEKSPATPIFGQTSTEVSERTNRLASAIHLANRKIFESAVSNHQLTADHSLVAEKVRVGILTPQEADASEMQSVLTRAVGTNNSVEVDTDEQVLLAGDFLLLCSDGLTRMLTDPEIASTLLTSASAQESADRLVELANENGGVDNVTVIVLQAVENSEGLLHRLKLWK
jgi:serine/threonine protein phosphatase PrpC